MPSSEHYHKAFRVLFHIGSAFHTAEIPLEVNDNDSTVHTVCNEVVRILGFLYSLGMISRVPLDYI